MENTGAGVHPDLHRPGAMAGDGDVRDVATTPEGAPEAAASSSVHAAGAAAVAAGPAPATVPASAVCVSCGDDVPGRFCPRCGERRAADRHYTLKEFAGEAFETITDTDSTVWRTIRALIGRPGELTRAYMAGVRVPYMRPLQLFLVVNVLYFLWAGAHGERVFDTPLNVHLGHSLYGDFARARIDARLGTATMDSAAATEAWDRYAERFNDAATVQAPTLVIVMVPMFALGLAIVQLRRRRPALQHLVFALHVYTVMLLLAILQHYLVQWPMRGYAALTGTPLDSRAADNLIGIFMLAAMAVYIGMGLHRAYGDRRLVAAIEGTALGWTMLVHLALYRYLLFFVADWTVGS